MLMTSPSQQEIDNVLGGLSSAASSEVPSSIPFSSKRVDNLLQTVEQLLEKHVETTQQAIIPPTRSRSPLNKILEAQDSQPVCSSKRNYLSSTPILSREKKEEEELQGDLELDDEVPNNSFSPSISHGNESSDSGNVIDPAHTIVVKAFYKEDVRRITLDEREGYSKLMELSRKIYPFEPIVKYRDDECELVTMSSNEDFREAIRLLKQETATQECFGCIPTLRIFIFKGEKKKKKSGSTISGSVTSSLSGRRSLRPVLTRNQSQESSKPPLTKSATNDREPSSPISSESSARVPNLSLPLPLADGGVSGLSGTRNFQLAKALSNPNSPSTSPTASPFSSLSSPREKNDQLPPISPSSSPVSLISCVSDKMKERQKEKEKQKEKKDRKKKEKEEKKEKGKKEKKAKKEKRKDGKKFPSTAMISPSFSSKSARLAEETPVSNRDLSSNSKAYAVSAGAVSGAGSSNKAHPRAPLKPPRPNQLVKSQSQGEDDQEPQEQHKLEIGRPRSPSSPVPAGSPSMSSSANKPASVTERLLQKRLARQANGSISSSPPLEASIVKSRRRGLTDLGSFGASKGSRVVNQMEPKTEEVVVPPDTQFYKTWVFRNDSNDTWPKSLRLVFLGGLNNLKSGKDSGEIAVVDLEESDVIGDEDCVQEEQGRRKLHMTRRAKCKLQCPPSVTVSPNRCLLPGEEVEVKVPLTAPGETGKFKGYWRLQTLEGKRFRNLISLVVEVADDISAPCSLLDRTKALQVHGDDTPPLSRSREFSKK